MSDNHINIGRQERWISMGVGAAAVVGGYKRAGLSGLLISAAGVCLMRRGVTGNCQLYSAIGANTAQDHVTSPHELYEHGVHFEEGITVQKPAQELYDYWRDLSHMPEFMWNVKKVEELTEGKSHWDITGPAGAPFRFDAEIIRDEEGRTIAWRTVGGSDIEHAGSVRFLEAPGGRGTEVRMSMEYLPPGGKWTKTLAKIIGQDPRRIARENLRRFKQLMELGAIPTNEHVSAGRSSNRTLTDYVGGRTT